MRKRHPGPPPNETSVVSLITEIGKAEREFNTLQAGYRKLASTWFLAVCAGLGFLLKPVTTSGGQAEPYGYEPKVFVALGLAGYFGILLLGLLDIAVYHQLLLSYFLEGRKLEVKHNWLPKVRSNGRKVYATIYATMFYVGLATVAFAAPMLACWASKGTLPCWFAVILIVVLVVDFLAMVWASLVDEDNRE